MMYNKNLMRIFFAGPLTDLKNPEKTKTFYLKLAEISTDNGFDYFWAFQHGTDPNIERVISAKEVYKRDSTQLLKSDLMVAYIGEPSPGVGIEVELAHTHNIPVYVLYEKDRWTSRMLRGCPSVRKEIIFTSEKDCLEQFQKLLQDLQKDPEALML